MPIHMCFNFIRFPASWLLPSTPLAFTVFIISTNSSLQAVVVAIYIYIMSVDNPPAQLFLDSPSAYLAQVNTAGGIVLLQYLLYVGVCSTHMNALPPSLSLSLSLSLWLSLNTHCTRPTCNAHTRTHTHTPICMPIHMLTNVLGTYITMAAGVSKQQWLKPT